MIRLIFWSSIFALTLNNASAQMGGSMGGAEVVIPDVDGETFIWRTPPKWYPYSKTSELKIDAFIFPTGQNPQKWKEMLQLEQFKTTMGITDAAKIFELKTANITSCSELDIEKLKEQNENGYSMYQWLETCDVSDNESKTIRKAIVGNERLYLLSKVWQYMPDEDDLEEWLDYMDEVYVCDGSRSHDCTPPSGNQGGGGGGMSGGMGQ